MNQNIQNELLKSIQQVLKTHNFKIRSVSETIGTQNHQNKI
jgi:hypothetical protein